MVPPQVPLLAPGSVTRSLRSFQSLNTFGTFSRYAPSLPTVTPPVTPPVGPPDLPPLRISIPRSMAYITAISLVNLRILRVLASLSPSFGGSLHGTPRVHTVYPLPRVPSWDPTGPHPERSSGTLRVSDFLY